MALTERSRATLDRRLSDLIHDEEAVGEMLSNFPAQGLDEPATKDFVRAEVASVRADLADLRAELADQRSSTASMEQRLSALVHDEVRTSMHWTIGVMVSLFAILIAALGTFGA